MPQTPQSYGMMKKTRLAAMRELAEKSRQKISTNNKYNQRKERK